MSEAVPPPETAATQAAQAADSAADAAREASETTERAAAALEEASENDGVIDGAASLKETVTDQGGTVSDIVHQLDAIGFTVADTRFSLWSVLVLVLVIVGVIVFARVATWLAKKVLARFTGLDPSQQLLGQKLLSIAIWALAFFVAIDILGIDLTALAVFSGAMGLAIGFGLQKTFGNLIAGIILLMDRSIKPGDVIAITDQAGNETFGQIRKIGIRAVSITTRDEREYLIPNENLMINQVENWSYSSRQVRMQVPIGISYHCDIKHAEELMLEAAASCKRVLKKPEPTVWLKEFGDSSVNFVVHCWIVDPEEGVGNVRSEVLKKAWELFQANGIEIPFPQRDLNLRDNEPFQQLVAAISQRVEKGG
jgi:small-conductance mechanosensitive channel